MSAQYSCPKRLSKTLLALILINLEYAAAASALQYTNEFWIATNATGNYYWVNRAGGTIDNPLDGSTAANFDNNMNSLPPNSTIHIMAGVYQVQGSGSGWSVGSGQKIMGSGIDVTVLQMASGSSDGDCVVANSGDQPGTNIEVCDLTCDCNPSSSYDTYFGVALHGTGIAIRRVKVIHVSRFSGLSSESWGIVIGPGTIPSSRDNVIEECEVSQFAGGLGLSAISFNGGATNCISGTIRDNRVLLAFNPSETVQVAINGSWTHDLLVEGNYVYGADVCYGGDTGGCTNVIVAHNHFVNVGAGIGLANTCRQNLTFAFNYIEFTNEPDAEPVAFYFQDNPGASYTNVVIIGNTVRFDGTGKAYFLDASKVTGLEVFDNSVDASVTNNFDNDFGGNIDNNHDLSGNYLWYLNVPTVGGTQVTDLGLSLLSSTNSSEVLTNLGLPSNVGNVLTNDYTQAVTLNNNLTVNGSATITGQESLDYRLAIGGAALNMTLSAQSASSCVAEFLSSDPYRSMLRFGDTNLNHLMYFGVWKDAADSFRFFDEGGHTNTPMMVIDSSQTSDGNVGIGTNTPSQRLTVAGGLLVTGTNSAAYLAGDMSQGSNYNAGTLTGTEPVAVLNPIVSTNHSFFILPGDGYIANTGGGAVSINYITSLVGNAFFAWCCPSNSSALILRQLPLPNDYWGGKLNYVSTWNVQVTNFGTYSFGVALDSYKTNNLAEWQQQTITFTNLTSTTNTFTISATNSISTANTYMLQTWIYTGNQVQPGNFAVLNGKVTAQ